MCNEIYLLFDYMAVRFDYNNLQFSEMPFPTNRCLLPDLSQHNYIATMRVGEFSDDELVYEESTVVGGYDVGPSYRAKCHRLIEIMHDASTRHVLQLGLSARELQTHHLTWVLIRQRVEINHCPLMDDRLVVRTYPSGKDRLYTFRDFVVEDKDGQTMVSSSSTWLLMDTQERKLAPYPQEIASLLDRSNDFPSLPRAVKLASLELEPEFIMTRIVRQSDLDFNGHLSSPHYYRWMLDALPSSYRLGHSLSEITVQVMLEGSVNDEVQVAASSTTDGWVHELRIGSKVLALGRSIWI